MAHKHQIWSSNKKTRKRSGRKWRRAAKAQLAAIPKRAAKIQKPLNPRTASYAALVKERLKRFPEA